MDKQVKFRRQAGMWRTLSFLLIIFSVCLIVALAVVSYRDLLSEKNASLGGQSSNTVPRTIDLSEPERPGPFHDLTTKEIDIINNFVQNDPSIKAKTIEEAKMTDSVVFMMDLLPAKKSVVQAYLAGERAQPERHARVVVFRGDLKPPMVHELDCGPLPEVSSCSLIKSTSRRNPIEFALRPIGPSEYGAIFDVLFQKVDKEIGYILRESYGMSFFDCTPPRCLKAYPAPVGSNIVGNTQHRSIWLGAAYPVDYYTENMVDFGILANMDGSDPSKHHISKIWYHAQYFESVDEFIAKYNQSRIHMHGMSKQLIPEGKNNEPTASWARHQLVVTKHKDDEERSSTPYGMFDSLNPVVNFSKFYDDNESIVDEDLVFWISNGIHHIPHSEDLPITPTVGAHLAIFLSPYNYFRQCPSFSSRDHVRVQLKDPDNPKEGVTIDRNGYKDEQCRTPQYATEYDELIRNVPNVVVESGDV